MELKWNAQREERRAKSSLTMKMQSDGGQKCGTNEVSTRCAGVFEGLTGAGVGRVCASGRIFELDQSGQQC